MGVSTPNCGALLSSGMPYSTAAPMILTTLCPPQLTVTTMGSNAVYPLPSVGRGQECTSLEVFQVHRSQRLWEEFEHFFHGPATSAVHFANGLWVRNERQAFAANSKRVACDVLRQIGCQIGHHRRDVLGVTNLRASTACPPQAALRAQGCGRLGNTCSHACGS